VLGNLGETGAEVSVRAGAGSIGVDLASFTRCLRSLKTTR